MKILSLILKTWLVGLIIVLPIALSLCKAARLGDKSNKFIDTEK